jgi:hypothetical protein
VHVVNLTCGHSTAAPPILKFETLELSTTSWNFGGSISHESQFSEPIESYRATGGSASNCPQISEIWAEMVFERDTAMVNAAREAARRSYICMCSKKLSDGMS